MATTFIPANGRFVEDSFQDTHYEYFLNKDTKAQAIAKDYFPKDVIDSFREKLIKNSDGLNSGYSRMTLVLFDMKNSRTELTALFNVATSDTVKAYPTFADRTPVSSSDATFVQPVTEEVNVPLDKERKPRVKKEPKYTADGSEIKDD